MSAAGPRPARPGPTSVAWGLLRSAHAEPSLVVTTVTVGLGVGVGLAPARLGLLGIAALSGQLSVGWSNDLLDARRGLDAGRADKPLAMGAIPATTVRAAAGVALGVTVVASLLLGVVPGLLHLAAVAAAWAYNAGLKATPLSILPYAAAFAALPVVVTTTAGEGLPRPWAIIAAACFGAGVHLSNVLPDIAADRAAGVAGLPQRMGETSSALGAAVLLGIGATAALLGPFAETGDVPGVAMLGLALAALALAISVVATRRGGLELAYKLTVAVGLLVVAALVAAGGRLV